MLTCLIRYEIDPDKLADFEQYARSWIELIEKYGGTHHGYFLPAKNPPVTTLSFPGLGRDGPTNIAIALFSFPSLEAYESYRVDVTSDPACKFATERFVQTQPFTGYERQFLEPLIR
ncbi:MAG: NIPSNAP family protein [Pyrinomonadaceae bacterium]